MSCAPIHKALKCWQITNGRNGSKADIKSLPLIQARSLFASVLQS